MLHRSRILSLAALALLASACPSDPPRSGSTEGSRIVPKAAASPGTIRRLDGSLITPSSVDQTATRLMHAGRVPGLALAILNEGKVVYLKAYGYRNVEKKEPLTEDSVMVGASFTKAVFAYTIMQLVQEGVLNLDKPVYEYFDTPLIEDEDYRDLAGDERYKKITPRMLLSHTSGLPNWRRFNESKKLDIKADPGTRYVYSGEGIVLLQRVMKQLTGRSTTDVIRERVFDRFGMTRTSMVWQPAFESDYSTGYDENGNPLEYPRRTSPDAAGSMATTIRDYAKFLEGVLRGDGLRPETREEMLRPQVRIHSKYQFPPLGETTKDNDAIRLSYGLGWGLFWTPYGKAYFKEGHDDGWENYSVTFEEKKIALLLMTNSSNGESIFKELLETLIGNTFTPWVWENYVPYNQP